MPLTAGESCFLKLHQQPAEDAQSKGTNNFVARLCRLLLGVCHFTPLLTVPQAAHLDKHPLIHPPTETLPPRGKSVGVTWRGSAVPFIPLSLGMGSILFYLVFFSSDRSSTKDFY